jgi:hypothetical protein
MKSAYMLALEMGLEIDNHESDLYVEFSQELLDAAHPDQRRNATTFTSNGKAWLEFPFAYEPWWERRAKCQSTECQN